MPRIVTLPGADQDVDESVGFYAGPGSGVELRFTAELRRVYERIGSDPDRIPIEFGKVRRCRMGKFPFRVFYVNFGETILIVAVAHTKRRPGYWKSRLAAEK